MAKVGIITYDFFPLIGGIGSHTYLMYSALKSSDLLFFSPADNQLPRHIRILFWPIRFIKQAGVSVWLHLYANKIIAKYNLKKLNVHSGAGGVLLVRGLSVPVIITCHHTYYQQYTHLPAQFWKRIFFPFEKRTYRLADRIVCVSLDTTRTLIEHYGIPNDKIVVIHNAVDTGKFFPLNLPRQPHTILYIGRIDKRKGIDFLIKSLPLVLRQIPEARLVVGGKGGYLEEMKSLVRRLNLEEQVSFLGFVPDDQLNELYNRAACVVVPSIFEGFGITVIEALAAGTRVVGTNVDGIREILADPDYGSLVPYGDTRTLGEAIVTELRNPRGAGELPPEYQVDQLKERYSEMLGG